MATGALLDSPIEGLKEAVDIIGINLPRLIDELLDKSYQVWQPSPQL
jgi:hypothetical protein